MRTSLVAIVTAAALASVGAPSVLRAQADTTRGPSCEGLRVTSIDIRTGRPPFEGSASRWRHAARAVGLHHATTRPGVIDAFSLLAVGDVCTEQRRAESERLIRDQPFIADAHVRAIPDGAGGVAIVIETVDEVP